LRWRQVAADQVLVESNIKFAAYSQGYVELLTACYVVL
jgi:hypothetical protein